MLEQIAQAGCQNHQQQHDEGRGGNHRPLALQRLDQGAGGSRVARQLQQSHQSEDPQETQIEQLVQQALQEERHDRQKIDDDDRLFRIFEATAKATLEARVFHAGVQAEDIFHREDEYRDRIKHDELHVQHIVNRFHRFQHHGHHGDEHPPDNKGVQQLLQLAAGLSGIQQRIDLLTEGAACIQAAEFLHRRDHDAEQLEQSQQSQYPQHAQVHRNERREVERQDRSKIDQRVDAEDVSQTRHPRATEFRVFWRDIQAEYVFDRENDQRELVEYVEQKFVGLVDCRHVLGQHADQVGDDQYRDPFVKFALQVVRVRCIEQPGIDKITQRERFFRQVAARFHGRVSRYF